MDFLTLLDAFAPEVVIGCNWLHDTPRKDILNSTMVVFQKDIFDSTMILSQNLKMHPLQRTGIYYRRSNVHLV